MRRMPMVARVLAIALALAGCGSLPPAAVPPASPAVPTATTEPSAIPTAAASVSVPATPQARLEDPAVAVSSDPFPIVTSLSLRPKAIDESAVASARSGLTSYLAALDRYRDNNFDDRQLPLTGPFRDAVMAGLKGSATPGVQRQFALESVRVERLFEKPWGTRALAEVTATIVDRAVSGTAPDQRETGRLRLTGEKNMQVSDGWDADSRRWFNGAAAPSAEDLRRSVSQPISSFLRLESWLPGSPVDPWRQSEPTPFSSAHAARVATIDRSLTISRSFDAVRAAIERYDTFDGVPTGIATVRLTGAVVTTDAGARTERAPFERRVKVLLYGGWAPEVVDEETAPGIWLSGGDLALQRVDVNRA